MKNVATLGQNLTEKEIIFLTEFGRSDFYDGLDSSPWDYSVNDNLPYTGKVRSGVVSSLEQKGIILVQRKSKGDIAGYYTLTDEALEDTIICNLVDGQKNPIEEPVVTKPSSKKTVPTKRETNLVTEPVVEPTIDLEEHCRIIESTWIDRVETRGFEKQYLTILGTKHSCEVSSVRNKETNHDTYIIIGSSQDREKLISEYELNLPQVREASHKAYLESDRSLSEFKFTTAYQTGFLELLSISPQR